MGLFGKKPKEEPKEDEHKAIEAKLSAIKQDVGAKKTEKDVKKFISGIAKGDSG